MLQKEPDVKEQATYLVSPTASALTVRGRHFEQPSGIGGAWGNTSKPFLQVDYSNLKNSYYTNANGVQQKVGKIRVIYSNLVVRDDNNAAGNNGLAWIGVNRPDSDGGSFININSWFARSLDQQIFLYDNQDNLINMNDDVAWLPITSLTRWQDWQQPNNRAMDHVESVKVLSGGTLYAVEGGNATMHNDGSVYEDKPTTEYSGRTFETNPNAKGDGAALAKIQNGVTLRWGAPSHVTGSEDLSDDNWFYFSVSTAPMNAISVENPIRKTSNVRYHYDVTTNRQKIRRCRLHSILRKYDGKLLKSVNK